MERKLISSEIIKLAKEKGFISRDKLVSVTEDYFYLWLCELQKFLREVHKIYIEISVKEAEVVATWYWKIFTHRNIGKGLIWINNDSNGVLSNTYEEALEIALQEALKTLPDEKTT